MARTADAVGSRLGSMRRSSTSFFTTKDVGSGTGQGLSIARAAVAAHGGTISFETSSAGTTFFIRLPLTGGEGARASGVDPSDEALQVVADR
jgi:hypothetical protein